MSTKPDGGNAFPCINPHYDGNWQKNPVIEGMTIRDWFAGQALASLVTSAIDLDHEKWDATAKHAYLIADAMLKERVK